MSKFFDLFPRTMYNIDYKSPNSYQYVTNIFFRLRIIKEVISNISSYYEYLIKDDDKPEILAEKIYGDAEAHWIILLANDIRDCQYDWPLNYKDFNNYITKKYGSIATAKSTIHHYEKVITREESSTGTITETRFKIDQANTATVSGTNVPYDTWNKLLSASTNYTYQIIEMGNGKTVIQKIEPDQISCYDYEYNLNEAKRNIKIIKKEYYSQIMSEFGSLTNNAGSPFLRKLV